eukprot:GILJ01006585.1.p1 GENE.GILJ01006585.1~~GILJ01006585.1.p1  ORF type:complete len:452 (-),score=50.26 GILJ01006585.1:243-1550(-)
MEEGAEEGIMDPAPLTYSDEDDSQPAWYKHKRHVLVLTSAGKPIYSRYGDESRLSGFTGTVAAIVGKLSTYFKGGDDSVRYMRAGKHLFVFLLRGPVWLVAISCLGEGVAQLERMLHFVYQQIVCILTATFAKTLTARPNYDLRNLLGGTDVVLGNVVRLSSYHPGFMLGAFSCLCLEPSVRHTTTSILRLVKSPEVVLVVLFSGSSVVSLLKKKNISIHAEDLLLVSNFVMSSKSLRASESWTPICLPLYQSSAFFQAYVNFIAGDLCLLMLSTRSDADHFYALSEFNTKITEELRSTGCLLAIEYTLENPGMHSGELPISELRHFIYKSEPLSQFYMSAFRPPYTGSSMEKALLRRYQQLHAKVVDASKSYRQLCWVTDTEMLFAWISADFQLLASFNPLTSKTAVVAACNKILRCMKQDEERLFASPIPTFL